MDLIIYDPGYVEPPDHLWGESAAGRRVYIRVVGAEREFSAQVDPFISELYIGRFGDGWVSWGGDYGFQEIDLPGGFGNEPERRIAILIGDDAQLLRFFHRVAELTTRVGNTDPSHLG